MDKKLIERIALEVAKDYLKFKLGDRKGLDIYDLDLDDEDLKPLIAEIERECADSFMQFLTRIDAERGKSAIPDGMAHPIKTAPKDGSPILLANSDGEVRVCRWLNNGKGYAWFWAFKEVSTPRTLNWATYWMPIPAELLADAQGECNGKHD